MKPTHFFKALLTIAVLACISSFGLPVAHYLLDDHSPESADTSTGALTSQAAVNAAVALLLAPVPEGDDDDDGVGNGTDNCLEASNPGQQDADGDGYGNQCDSDFNNDCVTNVVDLGAFRAAFFGSDGLYDLNSDGVVNVIDLGILRLAFFLPPGPSGQVATCHSLGANY